MSVFANVLVQDDATLLSSTLQLWKEYDVDKWIFHDAGSTDDTADIISDILGSRAVIIDENDTLKGSSARQQSLLAYSKENAADFIVSLAPAELLSRSLVDNFQAVLDMHTRHGIFCYWYHILGDMGHIRQDAPMIKDYRMAIFDVRAIEDLKNSDHDQHMPRVNLPSVVTRDIGIINLESMDKEYYALKKLHLKHREYKELKSSAFEINNRYDTAVNGLNFIKEPVSEKITADIDFDISVFGKLKKEKNFKEYILENKVEDLITFGTEYLT